MKRKVKIKNLIIAMSLVFITLLLFMSCEKKSHTHILDKGRIIRSASCSKEGLVEYSCNICGEKMEEIIPPYSHVYVALEHEGDEISISCKLCGEVLLSEAHSYGEWVKEDNTCNEERVCSCGAKDSRESHNWKIETSKRATCTEDGFITYICTKCGKKRDEGTESEGHDFSFISHDENAHYYVCPKCGEESIREEHEYSTLLSSNEKDLTHTLFCKCGLTITLPCVGSGERLISYDGSEYEKCSKEGCTNKLFKKSL